MLNYQSVRDIVTRELLDLLMESSQEQVILANGQLHDLGVNSLLLARLIVQLNFALDVDPFAQGATIANVRTLDDVVEIYAKELQIVMTSDV
jgi:hypothetical protein